MINSKTHKVETEQLYYKKKDNIHKKQRFETVGQRNINTFKVPALKKQNISKFVSKFVAKLLKNRILFKGILIFVSNNSGNNYRVAMVSPNFEFKIKRAILSVRAIRFDCTEGQTFIIIQTFALKKIILVFFLTS